MTQKLKETTLPSIHSQVVEMVRNNTKKLPLENEGLRNIQKSEFYIVRKICQKFGNGQKRLLGVFPVGVV